MTGLYAVGEKTTCEFSSKFGISRKNIYFMICSFNNVSENRAN